jgi:hypothetical protein
MRPCLSCEAAPLVIAVHMSQCTYAQRIQPMTAVGLLCMSHVLCNRSCQPWIQNQLPPPISQSVNPFCAAADAQQSCLHTCHVVRLLPASPASNCAHIKSCCCLCDACRPIVDNGVWVGYLAKVRYNQKGAPFAWDTMKPHFNWGAAGTTNGDKTGSATGATVGLGICMNCTGE